MAKVEFTAMVASVRGKLAGTVFSKNRGGAYIRTKVTPSNPQTTAQSNVRARITQLSKAFGALIAAQIAAWNSAVGEYAKTNIFGDLRNPSGLNLFVKLNANLLEAGQPVISDPPPKQAVETMTIIGMTFGVAGNAVSFETGEAAIPANHVAVVRATAQVSPGVSNFSGKFRNIVVKSAVDSPSEFDLSVDYVAKFGDVILDKKAAFELVLINTNTGQKGAVSRITAVASA